MTSHRDSESYVFPDGPCVVLTARFALQLLSLTNLDRVRTQRRGADPDFDAQALAIRRAAMSYVESGSAQVPFAGSVSAPKSEPASRLRCSPAQAAEVIGISSRAVLKAIHEQRLPAIKDEGRWVIQRRDVDDYRSARAA